MVTHGNEMVQRVIFTFSRSPKRINMRLHIIMIIGKQTNKQQQQKTNSEKPK